MPAQHSKGALEPTTHTASQKPRRTPVPPPYPIWMVVVAILALFIVFQFSTEINRGLYHFFYAILIQEWAGRIALWLQTHSGFTVYHPRFWAKVVYSLLLVGLIGAALISISRPGGERRLVLGTLALALLAVALMNLVGKLAGNFWLTTFSRDSLEFVLSPLPPLFWLPVLKLVRGR